MQKVTSDVRARIAVTFLFVFTGAATTTWAVHIPVVKERFDLSNAQVGWVIMMLGLGAFTSMQFMGHLIDKRGSKFGTVVAGLCTSVVVVLPGLATNVYTLCAALFAFGFFLSATDVSMNAQAVELEKRYGRPIFSAFHAYWSTGCVIGATLGAAALAAGWPMFVTLATVGAMGLLMVLVANSWFLSNVQQVKSVENSLSKKELKAQIKLQNAANRPYLKLVIALGIMAGSGALIEGVGLDWSALFSVGILKVSASQAAISVTVFSAAMASFRFVADKVVARVGRIAVIRYGSALAAIGVAFAITQSVFAISIVGWLIAGLGISAVVPQIFAYSASVGAETHAGRNMAIVFGLCYAAMLGGPAVIGWVSSLAPLNIALWIGVLLGAYIFTTSLFLPKDRSLVTSSVK
jgi:MFS family permease